MTAAIVDTGPLIAFFDRAEQHHRWVAERIEELDAPLLVCEPVLAEAMFLLARFEKAQNAMLALVENGALNVAFRVDEHIGELRKLLHRYRNIPMSLADACIVRMSEIHDRHAVLTLDSDFSIYRKHGGVGTRGASTHASAVIASASDEAIPVGSRMCQTRPTDVGPLFPDNDKISHGSEMTRWAISDSCTAANGIDLLRSHRRHGRGHLAGFRGRVSWRS
jgi:uncharacterized protein